MSYGLIATLMFSSMMLLLMTGQRIFAVIGFVGATAAVLLWGVGGIELPFTAIIKVMKWYPLLTLPLFVFMGYMLAESKIADDLYKMFHVWFGSLHGGLAIGTILMMVIISAINGLSVAGMAVGCTIALPALLSRGYDKAMVTGVIQAGSTLGILIPPSVVLVLYGMIARQPVGNLWMAGVFPGLLMASLFILYIVVRCWLQPELGPPLPKSERDQYTFRQKLALGRGRRCSAGHLPVDDRSVPDRRDQPCGEFGGRRRVIDPSGVVARRADLEDHARHDEEDAWHLVHVLLDHHGRAVLRRRV